jgi:hypothetical protein
MSPLFHDSRKSKRRLIDYRGWLQLATRRQPVECMIRDMSDTGACLLITSFTFSIEALPRRFKLWLDKNGKVKRECEVVWSRADYVGVRFVAR